MDQDGDGAINESDLCSGLSRVFGSNPELFKELWDRESNGRKVFELTDLKLLCNRIPEYALLFQIYQDQNKPTREETFNG